MRISESGSDIINSIRICIRISGSESVGCKKNASEFTWDADSDADIRGYPNSNGTPTYISMFHELCCHVLCVRALEVIWPLIQISGYGYGDYLACFEMTFSAFSFMLLGSVS